VRRLVTDIAVRYKFDQIVPSALIHQKFHNDFSADLHNVNSIVQLRLR
jgi:hypothetical protein